MSSPTTACAFFGWLLISVMVAHGAESSTSPIPCERPIWYPVDRTLQLSGDGQTLVWVRVRERNVLLCRLFAPFTGARGELPLGPADQPLPTVRLSFDGRHAFWSKGAEVWHAALEKDRLEQPTRLPVKAGLFDLQCNADGSVLSMLIDGPDSPKLSPSYRVVATAYRTQSDWIQPPPLTAVEHGKLAEGVLLDGQGRYLIFTLGAPKQAVLSHEGWNISPLKFPGYAVSPAALSVDGQVLLLRGRKADEQPVRPEIANLSHVWLSRRAKDQWQTPELVLRDRAVNYYNLAMSPDGRWLAWVEFERDEKMNILSTRLRRMCHERQGWREPQTVTGQDGCLEVENTCIADDGTVAWSTSAGEHCKGYVQTPGGKAICLD